MFKTTTILITTTTTTNNNMFTDPEDLNLSAGHDPLEPFEK
jgi:hypothetical protein